MSFKIRLMFLHPTFTFGGVERTMSNLIKGLSPDEFEITYITSKNIAKEFSYSVVKKTIFIEDLGISIWYGKHFWKEWLKDAIKISKIVKENKPDIVLGLMYYASSLLSLANIMGLLKGIKIISSPRGPMMPYYKMFHKEKTISNRLIPLSYRCFCRFSHSIIVASKGLKDECISLGADANKVFIVPNSINKELLEKSHMSNSWKHHTFFNSGFIIASSGRLTDEKDFSVIINAVKILIDKGKMAKLVIIGEGHNKNIYENLIKRLGIEENVLLTGFVQNPFEIFRLSNIFCHSCLFEGFGNVLIEAMACGLPVISTDCPFGPRDIIDDGINGYLVPMGNEKKIAEKIEYLMGNIDFHNKMSHNALIKGNSYTVERMIKGYRDVFIKLADYKNNP